jgi:hypothetical protein
MNKYDLTNIPQDADLLEVFPELKAYDEFASFTGDKRFVRYVLLAYNKDCKEIGTISNIATRKETALIQAGFKKTKRGFEDEAVSDVIAMKDPDVVRLIFRFFKIQNDRLYASWISGQELFWQQLEMVATPIDMADLGEDKAQKAMETKASNFTKSNNVSEELEKIEQRLFADNEIKDVVEQASKINPGFVEEFILNQG